MELHRKYILSLIYQTFCFQKAMRWKVIYRVKNNKKNKNTRKQDVKQRLLQNFVCFDTT